MINTIIVDDEPAVAKIISHFVDKENIPINIIGTASNGLEALELFKKHDEIQLVFLDIHMPYMDGFKVIENEPNKDYIIVTAYDYFQYAQLALRLGAKDIILKPIDYKKLIQSLTRVIGWSITDNPTFNEILEYINTNYSYKIDLTILSNEFFISSSHISRLFKKHMNTSTISYINEVRIKNAIELLKDEKLSIKEVAEKVGYESLNNFYKYFKLHTGVTPAVYMQG